MSNNPPVSNAQVRPIKGLSLWQPWASLIALKVKTIETRGWSTNYRGTLAIHAAKTPLSKTVPGHWVGEYCTGTWTTEAQKHVDDCECPDPDEGDWAKECEALNTWEQAILKDEGAHGFSLGAILPFGAIVATAELYDVVPMVGPENEGDDPVLVIEDNGHLTEWSSPDYFGEANECERWEEKPYGDYQVGRFAWLLTDITPLKEPVPYKGRQGLWDFKPEMAEDYFKVAYPNGIPNE